MIRKPEEANYLMIIIMIICSVIATAAFGWFMFLHSVYLTPNNELIPIQWDYVKACINPFDQNYCEQIKNAMEPNSAHRFYIGGQVLLR